MKLIKRFCNNLIACLVLFGFLISVSFAWFAASIEIDTGITAISLNNYFAGGTGESTDPYILNSPRHVYNLAWLQNIGAFNPGGAYFKMTANINMAGSIKCGAVPPIGSTTKPFVGNFDGNGYTISNLWVSSDPDDWQENPEGYGDYDVGTDIGFFGNVGTNALIKDVFLENIEVTNHKASASVGLVAGYVAASVRQVGVKNGLLSFTGGSANSENSLIGRVEEGVLWTDKPHETNQPSNGLLINPTGDGTASVGNGKAPKGATLIEGADTPDDTSDDKYSAYYYGNISASTPQPQPKGTYIYKGGDIAFDGAKKTYQVQAGQTELLTANTQNVDASFKALMLNKDNPDGSKVTSYNIITISGQPTFIGNMPSNAVWFDPQTKGTCVVAFMKTDNSANNVYGAIYRYKRAQNGSIDRSTLQEVALNMPKKGGGVDNGYLAYFQFQITDLDYEYVIANSSYNQGNAKFVFLRLAGAGESDDDDTDSVPVMRDIDFMEVIPTTLAGATTATKTEYWEAYNVHKTYLQVANATTGKNYYNALPSDGLVHYCATGGATVTETLTSPESQSTAYSTTTFPPRSVSVSP